MPIAGRFTLVLALSACVLSNCSTSAVANPALHEIGDDPGLGFNLISWWGGAQATHWESAIQTMYDAGFREVSIAPLRFFNTDTGALTTSGAPSLSGLSAGVGLAKSLGMRVTLDPFVEPVGFSIWRGQYNPAGPAATTFWTGYQQYLVEVAQIAATHQVDAMLVGTELRAITRDSSHNADWNNAINAVRNVFDGPLGYAANWDNFDNENVTAALWEHPEIDFLGIDAYFNNLLTGSNGYLRAQNPSLSNNQANNLANQLADSNTGLNPGETFADLMTAAWNHKLDTQILPFAAGLKDGAGLPVVFTEVGYLPRNRTGITPQNEGGSVDTEEQIMAFQGLIQALDGRADEFHAMHIWQWHMAGSDGSLWNIDPTLPANQPNNVPLGQWLSSFASTAVLPLAGDYNRDGAVDAADYTAWRDSLGQFVANFNSADGNGNGVIDAADFEVWRANVGAVSGGAAAEAFSVPEPASLLLLSACLLLAVKDHRHRVISR